MIGNRLFTSAWTALMFALVSIGSNAVAADGTVFQKASIGRAGSAFETRLTVAEGVADGQVDVRYINETVQIEIPNASFPKGKLMLSADDETVKSVYLSETEEGAVRVRFILNKNISARSFDGAVEATRADGALVLRVLGSGTKSAARKSQQEIHRSVAISNGAAGTETLDVPTRLVAGARSPASGVQPTPLTPETAIALARAEAESQEKKPEAAIKVEAKVPESQIPIAIDEKKEKRADSDPIRRALLAAFALAVVLGVGAFSLRKMARRNTTGKQTPRIQILGQHYLGPKKSLALVHVAGESILIGVTENNITLIKSIALIDDEVPANLPNRFEGAMETAEAAQDGDFGQELSYGDPRPGAYAAAEPVPRSDEYGGFAMHGLSEIQDVVSGRFGKRARR